MTAPANGRVCSETGLYLLPAAAEVAHRVAKDRYVKSQGINSARFNEAVGQISADAEDSRGRFDTFGRTVYFADSPKTAFAEVLQGFRKSKAALVPDAEAAGVPVDQYIADVVQEARANQIDAPWAISVDWQMERSIWQVKMPADGWWVAIDHPSTQNRLTDDLFGELYHLGYRQLHSGIVAGDDRAVTTVVAEHIRNLVLDDGNLPLGISFQSKTEYGRCWAFWNRRMDDGLVASPNDPQALDGEGRNVAIEEFETIARDYDLAILTRGR
ncbi:hypothetical protein [Isoptericola sp. NPDC019482]|uniref:hypothetical protein n=1 Tax=Isoptericola sp. NPDC019482 TaxID=3154688 RepID=UPI0034786CEA